MIIKILLRLFVFALLTTGIATAAAAASFDCSKASKPDEIAVCKNPSLSALDSEMGGLWFTSRQLPSGMGGNAARLEFARAFLKDRAACGSNISCLNGVYQARVAEMKDEITQSLNQLGSAPESQLKLPPGVQQIIYGYAGECRQLGGTLPAGADQPLIMTGDFDGDGEPDYVLNPQNLQCSGAATAFCGNGGCNMDLVNSINGYQKPIEILGGQPTISQQSDGTNLEVWVDGANCNLVNRDKACWAIYSWKNGKAETVYRAKALQDQP